MSRWLLPGRVAGGPWAKGQEGQGSARAPWQGPVFQKERGPRRVRWGSVSTGQSLVIARVQGLVGGAQGVCSREQQLGGGAEHTAACVPPRCAHWAGSCHPVLGLGTMLQTWGWTVGAEALPVALTSRGSGNLPRALGSALTRQAAPSCRASGREAALF